MDCCVSDGLLGWCGGRRDENIMEPSMLQAAARIQQDPVELGELQRYALVDMRCKVGPCTPAAEDKELLRFLVARKWHVDAAVEQFQAMLRWRKDNDVDRIRRKALGPFGPEAASRAAQDLRLSRQGVEMFPQLRLVEPTPTEGALLYYGQTIAFGFDKKGQPVQIQNGGLAGWRFRDFVGVIGGSDHVLDSLVRMHELQAARMEEASRRHGRPITKQVVITNAHGMPLRPHPSAVAAFKDFLVVSSRYYPESLAVLFVVNAPPVFVALYRLIKTWLDPVTASKIQVLGRNFQPVLLEHIDADQLPRNYGGSVDFDILGSKWSQQDCEHCVNGCRQALQQEVRERQLVESCEADKPWPRFQRLFVLSILLLIALCGMP